MKSEQEFLDQLSGQLTVLRAWAEQEKKKKEMLPLIDTLFETFRTRQHILRSREEAMQGIPSGSPELEDALDRTRVWLYEGTSTIRGVLQKKRGRKQ